MGLALMLAGARPLLGADEKSSVEQVRKECCSLKRDAASATKRAAGVNQVIDKKE